MADVAVGDIYRIAHRTTCGSQIGVNVVYYEIVAVSAPPPSIFQLARGISANAAPFYRAMMAPQARFEGVTLTQPLVTPTPSAIAVDNGTGVGAMGTLPLPGQVCGILSLYTDVAGRANRGRKYVPFPPSEANEFTVEPVPTAGYLTLMDSLALLYVATFEIADPDDALKTATLQPVIFHGAPPLINRPVTFYAARKKWATQRGRGSFGAAEF